MELLLNIPVGAYVGEPSVKQLIERSFGNHYISPSSTVIRVAELLYRIRFVYILRHAAPPEIRQLEFPHFIEQMNRLVDEIGNSVPAQLREIAMAVNLGRHHNWQLYSILSEQTCKVLADQLLAAYQERVMSHCVVLNGSSNSSLMFRILFHLHISSKLLLVIGSTRSGRLCISTLNNQIQSYVDELQLLEPDSNRITS